MTDPQPELESQIAFLEDTVAELDRALASQQQQILELQSQLRFLHEEMKTHGVRLDAVDAPADPPPPHY